MNIEMLNNQSANHRVDVDKNQYGNQMPKDSRMKTAALGYSLDITGTVMENAAYGKEELKSVQDIALEAGKQNVTLNRNYAAVMSNSMSAEDYAELTKDGVNPTDTNVGESVTNLDKIKIKMAEAGMTIVGYNDDLSSEDIENVVANAGLAESIVKALEAADLPATKDNIESMEEGISLNQKLKPMSDDAMKYMLLNDLEPTAQNIYKAEYSSLADSKYEPSLKELNWDDISDKAYEIINETQVDKSVAADEAKWLVAHDVPLTKETIEKLDTLKNIALPVAEKDILKAMTAAIAEGDSATKANLADSENLYDKAVRIVNDFANMEDGGDITKRRQLEEVRLAMTAEANLTLLRKGIQIETQPLVELIDKLKEAEKEFYRPVLLDEDKDSINKPLSDEADNLLTDRINLYKATVNAVKQIPSMPAEAVIEGSDNDFAINNVYVNGEQLKANYEKAGLAYETLMTAPRADMGDSMRKAFTNVDDILEDLDFDINDVNRKAVRTLGYAQMEITKESIESVREATRAVTSVINMMTPARVLSMIREGHNPLSENIYELEKSLSDETPSESAEKYSRFLWKLEKNNQITEDEKSAYIGMYRLFNQIEKLDGKIIGNVLNNGMELTMQNMLSASRSNRHKNMDVKIDDDFGVLEDVIAKSESISDQISKGFVQMINEPVDEEYVKEKLLDTQKAYKSMESAEGILESLNEPVTVENILALSDMSTYGGKEYRKLFTKDQDDDVKGAYSEGEEKLTDSDVEALLNDFSDKESAVAAYESFTNKAIEISKQAIDKAVSYDDIRAWQTTYRQLNLSKAMGRRETYEIPVMTEDGITAIHLTLNRGDETGGKVTASFETESFGRVNAQFTLKQQGVDGFIVTDSRAGEAALKGMQEKIEAEFSKNHIETNSISIVYGRNVQKSEYLSDINDSEATNRQLYNIAKSFIVALS